MIIYSCTVAHPGAHTVSINVSMFSIFSKSYLLMCFINNHFIFFPQAWIEHLQMKSNEFPLKESTLATVRLIFGN